MAGKVETQSIDKLTFSPLPEVPLVSILMPAYNAEKYITEAIQSTIGQGYSNWELLVMDDCSTDKTLHTIKSFKDERIRVYQNTENQGYLDSCNKLFKLAKGELITFLDADDSQASDRIGICVSAIQEDQKLGFVTSDSKRINEVGETLSSKKANVDYRKMATEPTYEVYFACASLMMRREALEAVRGYHPFFKGIGGEDYHMIWELSRLTQGTHIHKPLYFYRKHAGQNQFRISNPLKYFMMDILHDIRKKHIHENQNPLDKWESYRKWWVNCVNKNSSELMMRKASERLQLNQKTDAFFIGLNSVIEFPLTIHKIKLFARLIKRLILA